MDIADCEEIPAIARPVSGLPGALLTALDLAGWAEQEKLRRAERQLAVGGGIGAVPLAWLTCLSGNQVARTGALG